MNDTLSVKKNQPAADTLLKTVKDTLLPVVQKPFFDGSNFIDRRKIDRTDYKYAGDLFKNITFDYIRYHGLDGHPDENILYGVGYGGISYFDGGVLLNDRFSNNFDLNNISTEYLDSVEILPVTRGFLYGVYSNNAAVNFLERDFITKQPYSRIKYYQGPNGEAMIDAIFNQLAFKRFKISVDITNRKFDSSYVNSAYSQWMIGTGLKYYLSDDWNITASYNFTKASAGLNGGVNIDSLINAGLDVNSYLYDEMIAPVVSPNRNEDYKSHLFRLRFLGNYPRKSYTNLVFYYNYQETGLNDNNDTAFFKEIDKEKIAGVNFDQRIFLNSFFINLLANFETGSLKYYSLSSSSFNYYPFSYNTIGIAPVLGLNLLDSALVPSIFFKYSRDSYKETLSGNGAYSGWGADISYHAYKSLNTYLGFSNYKPGPGQKEVYNYEIGAGLSLDNLSINLNFFKRNNYSVYNKFASILDNNIPATGSLYYRNYPAIPASDMFGTSADLSTKVSTIALELHIYYYSKINSETPFYGYPQVNSNGGIYYENILFENNLDLKTGLAFKYIGKRNEPGFGELKPAFNLDFTLAGEIQKVAFVYFTWENLLGAKYYVIPYYPVPLRNIRFGIAWELLN